jgi:hypothetical protein
MPDEMQAGHVEIHNDIYDFFMIIWYLVEIVYIMMSYLVEIYDNIWWYYDSRGISSRIMSLAGLVEICEVLCGSVWVFVSLWVDKLRVLCYARFTHKTQKHLEAFRIHNTL